MTSQCPDLMGRCHNSFPRSAWECLDAPRRVSGADHQRLSRKPVPRSRRFSAVAIPQWSGSRGRRNPGGSAPDFAGTARSRQDLDGFRPREDRQPAYDRAREEVRKRRLTEPEATSPHVLCPAMWSTRSVADRIPTPSMGTKRTSCSYVTTAVKSLELDIPSAATSPARTVTWTGPFCGTASLSRTACAARSYDTRAIFTPLLKTIVCPLSTPAARL